MSRLNEVIGSGTAQDSQKGLTVDLNLPKPLKKEEKQVLRTIVDKLRQHRLLTAAILATYLSVNAPVFANEVREKANTNDVIEEDNPRERIFQDLEVVTSRAEELRVDGLFGRQILKDSLRAQKRKNLPGVTVNGKPVHEIAPGIYGNKNSYHDENIDIGTIKK